MASVDCKIMIKFPKSIFIDVLTESRYLKNYSKKEQELLISCSTNLGHLACDLGYPVISVLTSIKRGEYDYKRETAVAPFAEFLPENNEIIEKSFTIVMSSGYYIIKDKKNEYLFKKIEQYPDFKVIIYGAEKKNYTLELINRIQNENIFYIDNKTKFDEEVLKLINLKIISFNNQYQTYYHDKLNKYLYSFLKEH